MSSFLPSLHDLTPRAILGFTLILSFPLLLHAVISEAQAHRARRLLRGEAEEVEEEEEERMLRSRTSLCVTRLLAMEELEERLVANEVRLDKLTRRVLDVESRLEVDRAAAAEVQHLRQVSPVTETGGIGARPMRYATLRGYVGGHRLGGLPVFPASRFDGWYVRYYHDYDDNDDEEEEGQRDSSRHGGYRDRDDEQHDHHHNQQARQRQRQRQREEYQQQQQQHRPEAESSSNPSTPQQENEPQSVDEDAGIERLSISQTWRSFIGYDSDDDDYDAQLYHAYFGGVEPSDESIRVSCHEHEDGDGQGESS